MTLHTPLFLQPAVGDAAIDYTAQEFRQYVRAQLTPMSGVGGEQGVTSASSFKVTQRGAGANLSVDVASGLAYVLGDDVSNQGTYCEWLDATQNVTGWTVPGSGTYHHRLELQIQDKLSNGAFSGYVAAFVPKLDTGGGLPAEDNSALTLATIDIPTGSSSITNSMINDYRPRVGPVAASKTSATSRSSTTTVTDDPDLQLLNLQASATYQIDGWLSYHGGSGAGEGDLQFGWRASAGAAGGWSGIYAGNSGNFGWATRHGWGDSPVSAGTIGASNPQWVKIDGTLATGAAPAYLVLQWAQNSSTSTATVMEAYSFLRAVRIA